MEALKFEVELRDVRRKGEMGRLRRGGSLPGVVYGPGFEAVAVTVNERDFGRSIAGLEGAHLIELSSGDPRLDHRQVLVRDVQIDPLSRRPIHVDFYAAPLDRRIGVSVALHFEGKPVGVAAGGIMQPLIRELHVFCLPVAIPDAITVDVSGLAIHETLHVSQIELPPGVETAGHEDLALVTVLPPTVDKKAEEAATPAAAAPPAGAPAQKPGS